MQFNYRIYPPIHKLYITYNTTIASMLGVDESFPVFAGVMKLVHHLTKNNVPISVATSSSSRDIIVFCFVYLLFVIARVAFFEDLDLGIKIRWVL